MADCIVRTHLPLKDNLTPNIDSVGHFDIQYIGAITLSKPFDNNVRRTYTNPIVSYDTKGIDIYNNGIYNLPSKEMLCTITYSNVLGGPFENWLNQNCVFESTQSLNVSPKGVRDHFYVIGDGFENYSRETHSCFAACARWLDLMGDTTLNDIYCNYTYPNGVNDSCDPYGYKHYTAWPMFEIYHLFWNIDKLKT